MEPTRDTARRGATKAAGITGIIFAVLYVAGAITATGSPDNVEEFEDQPVRLAATWRDYYSDSGNRTAICIGLALLVLASVAVVIFAAGLRSRLADDGAPDVATRVAFAGAVLLAAFTIAGAMGIAWIPASKEFGDVPLPIGSFNFMAQQLGFGLMLIGGGAAASLLLGAAGWAAVRSRTLPAWLGWAGMVAGAIVLILGAFFMPMALVPLWVLAASIVLLARGRRSAARA